MSKDLPSNFEIMRMENILLKSRSRIKELENDNHDLGIELKSYDRILNALESHNPKSMGYGHREDVKKDIDTYLSELEMQKQQKKESE